MSASGQDQTHAERLRAVAAAARSGDVPRATELAESALADGIEHPMLLNLRAFRLEGEGRLDGALADLDRALVLAPGEIALINARGLCLSKLGRLEDARAAFQAVITAAPEFGPGHFNLGWTLESLGEVEAAKRSHERALAINPNDCGPLTSLAVLALRRGATGEARALSERALAVDPGNPAAVQSMASAELASDDAGSAEARLRKLLTSPSLGPADRAAVVGLLGDVLDKLGRTKEAFAAWTESNDTTRRLEAPRFGAPGAGAADMLVWLTKYFEAAPAWAWAPTPAALRLPRPEAAGHVFLMGFPRSGTTLLEQVLASHPQVVSLEERETLGQPVREFMKDPSGLDRLAGLNETEIAAQRAAYWRRVHGFGARPAGKVFIDKLPLNTVKLPLIAKLFPDAKILFALRDPRDVVLSGFRHRFRLNASMYELLTLEGAARFYDGVMGLAEACFAKLAVEPRYLRYEDLVADFETQVRAACTFIGVGWSPAVLGFSDRARRGLVATPSSGQVARGLYSGARQWVRYRDELAPVLPALKRWVDRFGYPAE